jgi:hypothetical protein
MATKQRRLAIQRTLTLDEGELIAHALRMAAARYSDHMLNAKPY